MIKVSNTYIQETRKPLKNEYVEFVIKDNEMQNLGIYGSKPLFSNLEDMILLGVGQYENVLTCEPNRFKLDKDYYIVRNYLDKKDFFISNVVSNENGNFITEEDSTDGLISNCYIHFYFEKDYNVKEKPLNLEIEFEEPCDSFKVLFYNPVTENKEYFYSNNDKKIISLSYSKEYNTYISSVHIYFYKTKEPYRNVKIKSINLGYSEIIKKDKISKYNLIEEKNLDSNTLIKNELTFNTITNKKYDVFDVQELAKRMKNKYVIAMHYLKVGQKYYRINLGRFFIDDVKKVDKEIEYNCSLSLTNTTGVYKSLNIFENKSAYEIIKEISGEDTIDKDSEEYFKNIELSGFIPYMGKINALKYVAQATNSILISQRNGNPKIIKPNYNNIKPIYRNIITNESINQETKCGVKINVYDYQKENYVTNTFKISNLTLTKNDVVNNQVQYEIQYTKPYYVNSIDAIIEGLSELDASIERIESNNVYSTIVTITIPVNENEWTKNEYNFKIKLMGTLLEPTIVETKTYGNQDETIEIKNPLITKSYNENFNIDEIGNYYLNLGNSSKLKLNVFNIPYVEVGDVLKYTSSKKAQKNIIINKIEFNDSYEQTLEGVIIDE